MPDTGPMEVGAAGCACIVYGGNHGQWTACIGAPFYAALWTSPAGKRWRVFLCELHRDRLPEARELTEGDRVALDMRRRRLAAALRGERWIPPRPLP